jgi:hypothetical protein
MNKRESIVMFLLPLLAAAALAVWAPRLFKAAGHKSPPKIRGYTQDEELKEIDAFVNQTALTQHSRMSPFDLWGRDPFYVSAEQTTPAEEWPVKGIFWREVDPSALIGEDVIEVGDKLGNYVVTNITPDAVVISDGRKVIKLQVGQNLPKP